MASVRQGVTVFKRKNGDIEIKSGSTLFVAVKKTGYYNFSIGGKSYYFDERMDTSKITNEVLLIAFYGGQSESNKRKKGKITVTRK